MIKLDLVESVNIGKTMFNAGSFHNADHIKFNDRYPGLSNHYAKLCKTINMERQARGELVEWPKKQQRVADADV